MKGKPSDARTGGRTPLRRALLYSFASLVFGFLILPTLVVVPLSVTESPYLHFPPEGFTWQWYGDYFGVEGASHSGTAGRWISATLISLELALLVVVLTVPVGALAAYGLSRGTYRGKSVLNAIILSPLVMPVLVTAIALFFFLVQGPPVFLPAPAPAVRSRMGRVVYRGSRIAARDSGLLDTASALARPRTNDVHVAGRP